MSNPNLPLSSLHNVGPGGRPPDTVMTAMDYEGGLGDHAVRYESRLTHEELGGPIVGVTAGHSRNSISSLVEEEMNQMDSTTQDSGVTTLPRGLDVNQGSSPTYTSMVANNPSMAGKKISYWKTDNDNVVESCGVALQGMNAPGVNSGNVDKSTPTRPSEPSAQEPFGPWMQVVSRRHKPSGLGTVGSCIKELSGGTGSQFDVLARDIDPVQEDVAVNGNGSDKSVALGAGSNEVPISGRKARMAPEGKTRVRFAAYVDSNLDLRSKGSVPSMSNVQVVAVGHGKGAEVQTQVKSLGNAKHIATTIVETNPYSGVMTGGEISKGVIHESNGGVVHDADVLDVSEGSSSARRKTMEQ
ncbi:hypothetical protein V6N13_110599 [Hibiscus sabdariffa]|uniref:Uncharacterized protein n=1 Tax=Hibiscus sabdariffa TaxID=183260 RepID=A0ABR2TI54_9ROSI